MSNPVDIDAMLAKVAEMSVEEKRALKKQLLQPDDKSAPSFHFYLDLTHHLRCQLCGRMWEEVHTIKTNEPDLPEPVIYLVTCFQCEYRLIAFWEKAEIVHLLVLVAKHGMEGIRQMLSEYSRQPNKDILEWSKPHPDQLIAPEDVDHKERDDSWIEDDISATAEYLYGEVPCSTCDDKPYIGHTDDPDRIVCPECKGGR